MGYRQPTITEITDCYQHTTPLLRFQIQHDGTTAVIGNFMTVRFILKPSPTSARVISDSSCFVTDSTRGMVECRLSLSDTTDAYHQVFGELRLEDHVLQTSDVVDQYRFEILPSLGG